ncbi:MAG: acyltransferase [Bacteroidetes bacterium]|nr:MAG: acyltransferase [Bacteroidota bacterium]
MQWFSRFIYFKILGWKVVGFSDFDNVKKAVIIAAPHTSWVDFPLGILLRSVLGIKTNFVGKKELFKFPHGWIFRALGGAPVERKNNQNQVEAIAKLFENHDRFRMAMSPEGTRKKVAQWRTGFYYIAKAANVPILMITLDFGKKENKISEPFYSTDDKAADFKFMKNYFKDAIGKVPEYT